MTTAGVGVPRPGTLPAGLSTEILIRRVVTILGLLGIALIHLIDLPSRLPGQPLIAASYLGLIVTSLALAETLTRHTGRVLWTAAAGLAAATIFAFIASRTVGLPGPGGNGDVGNWTEPLGIASLLVEGVVLMASGVAATRQR
jgi:hypothetical protein